MDKKKEFLERCGAQEYESVFEGISLKEMLGMRVKKMNKFLEKIAKVEVREKIWKQLQEEVDSSDDSEEEEGPGGDEKRVRREEEEGVQVLFVGSGAREPAEAVVLSDDEDEGNNTVIVKSEIMSQEEEEEASTRGRSNSEGEEQEERPGPSSNNGIGIVQDTMTQIKLEGDDQEVPIGRRRLRPRHSRAPQICSCPSAKSPSVNKTELPEGMVHLKIIESHRESNGTPLRRSIAKVQRRQQECTVSLTWAEWTSQNADGFRLPDEKIEQLTILWDYPEELPSFEAKFLPNLKRLEIHGHFGNFWGAICKIVEGCDGNLERIDFLYKENNDACLLSFLDLLTTINGTYLKGLKILNLCNKDCKEISLIHEHFELLSKVKAQSLQDLNMEFAIWGDEATKQNFEEVLQNFALSLRKLIVRYSFLTDQKDDPKLTLNFPKMPKLEELDLGDGIQLEKVIENLQDRPKKKKLKQRFICTLNEVSGTRREAAAQDDADEDCVGAYFSVSLQIPQMNQLKFIRCGFLYEIEDLHFTKFPRLKTFLISSPWNTNFKLPGPNSRHPNYRSIQEIQLPNELQDPGFASEILTLFPNLKKCNLNLPSVNVIRALAKALSSDEDPCPQLQCLRIQVRFDFSSSLNACILNEPWKFPQSEEELSNIATLKEYTHWKEYVQVNKIQVPNYEELQQEDSDKGLEALKGKLARHQSLIIEYIPRVLRLPKGIYHFNDDRCEFSDTLIGFNLRKMLISLEAASAIPSGWVFYNFDPSLANKIFRVRLYKLKDEGIVIDPLQVTPKQENPNNEIA